MHMPLTIEEKKFHIQCLMSFDIIVAGSEDNEIKISIGTAERIHVQSGDIIGM
jgi:primosomal replication protein N